MEKFGYFITKNKNKVLILTLILIIISFVGMIKTKINYNILVYLPQDIETIKGQEILANDFNMPSYSLCLVEGQNPNTIINIEEKIRNIDHVSSVVSIYDALGSTIPIDLLPDELKGRLNQDNTDIVMVIFDGAISDENTLNAVREIRELSDSIKQGGMSSQVLDIMILSEEEVAMYIVIAVVLCLIVLELSLDSYVVPVLLLLNIGISILFNLGTNIFLGEISYITKSLVAVLQLGVTTDFSIFLYHSYEEKKNKMQKDKAMALAIKETFKSVAGSSLTTIAGFLVLVLMQLALGKDLGIVMAKGVLLGVISVVTVFPSLLLVFDNLIEKTKHKKLIPKFNKLNRFVIKHHILIFVLFLIVFVPSYLSYKNVEVYYKLDKSLPRDLESIVSNEKLKDRFNIVSLEMILLDKDLKIDTVHKITDEIRNLDGIDFALSPNELNEMGIHLDMLESDKYKLLVVNSLYDVASDELNEQATVINDIVKKYDENAIVAGVGPLYKDLITISDNDFNNVNNWSIICIFIILFFVLRSLSLPFILIIVIETAIFMNTGISYFKGDILPFIAPIVLGTIQLGATIDYAILISNTYLDNRRKYNKKEAMQKTLDFSAPSIFVSGMCFFAATFAVGIYSKIEMIGSICSLLGRGAIVSMLMVILVLPSALLIFDKLIMKTTIKKGEVKMNKNVKKLASFIVLTILVVPSTLYASEKKETVYANINYDGTVKSVTVNEQLKNIDESSEDFTQLDNIINLSNESSYKKEDNKLTWSSENKNIIYQGTINKELPVVIKVNYKLNGQDSSLDEIIGKNGKVEITYRYINTDKHFKVVNGRTQLLYTPFVITLGTILDNSNASNITVNNGKIIDNGSKSVVVGLSAPGIYDSLQLEELKNLDTITISFDTNKFELPKIYNVITPKVIESSDLKAFTKIETLYSNSEELKTNIDKIEEGSTKLTEGITQIKDGLKVKIDALNKKAENPFNEEELNAITAQVVNEVLYNFENQDNSLDMSSPQVKELVMAITGFDNFNDYAASMITNTLKPIVGEQNLLATMACLQGDTSKCASLSSEDLQKAKAVYLNILSMMNTTKTFVSQVALASAKESSVLTANLVSKSLAPKIAGGVLKEVGTDLNSLYLVISELEAGANELNAGISTYNKEGITKLNNLVNNSLRPTVSKIEALTALSNEYKTFAGGSDETKFIITTDSKKAETKSGVAKKEEVKLTLWQRIKNLFK